MNNDSYHISKSSVSKEKLLEFDGHKQKWFNAAFSAYHSFFFWKSILLEHLFQEPHLYKTLPWSNLTAFIVLHLQLTAMCSHTSLIQSGSCSDSFQIKSASKRFSSPKTSNKDQYFVFSYCTWLSLLTDWDWQSPDDLVIQKSLTWLRLRKQWHCRFKEASLYERLNELLRLMIINVNLLKCTFILGSH